jgi:hypothetical protein
VPVAGDGTLQRKLVTVSLAHGCPRRSDHVRRDGNGKGRGSSGHLGLCAKTPGWQRRFYLLSSCELLEPLRL